MAMAPSSPRLPSPPPPAEIQIGPKSPSMGPHGTRQEQTTIDTNAKRRIHPGTRSADMAAGPPLIPLHELDSAFQLQEHLAALHYYHTDCNTTPMTRETARTLATPPPGTDKTLWLYELCRFLISQCNSLIVGFLFDTPPCSAATCPEMRASEWQFLCAVHDAPKSCCAIDYCCHTLDWAANVVTNPKIFPSRFVVDAHDKNTALKNLVNVFRRLHRIFAHAWFQHRGVFWSVEGQTGLYVLFKTVCDVYDLLPAENYKLPPEAEGLDISSSLAGDGAGSSERKVLLQHHQANPSAGKGSSQRGADATLDDENMGAGVGRTNTRRHIKSSPSTGSAVTTVPEADEDETAAEVTNRLRGMHISNSAALVAADEEIELSTIPVIVEYRPVEQPPHRPASVIPFPAPETITSMRELVDDFDDEEEPPMSAILESPAVPIGPEPNLDVHRELEPEPEAEPQAEIEYAQEPEQKPEPEPERELVAQEPEPASAPEVPVDAPAPTPQAAVDEPSEEPQPLDDANKDQPAKDSVEETTEDNTVSLEPAAIMNDTAVPEAAEAADVGEDKTPEVPATDEGDKVEKVAVEDEKPSATRPDQRPS